MQGQSLLPLIEGGEWHAEAAVLRPVRPVGYTADADEYRRRIRAVRTARWKLSRQRLGGQPGALRFGSRPAGARRRGEPLPPGRR